MPQFAAYEFIVYVVPGAFLLIAIMILFPQVRAFFGTERMDVGGLGLFLVISFAFGLMTNVLAGRTIERLMIHLSYAHRTDIELHANSSLVPLAVKERFTRVATQDFPELMDALKDCVGDDKGQQDESKKQMPDANLPCSEVQSEIIGRVLARANVKNAPTSRLEIYAQQYYVSLNVAMSLCIMLVVLAAAFFLRWKHGWLAHGVQIIRVPFALQLTILAVVLASIVLSAQRISNFDKLFAREFFASYAYRPDPVPPCPCSQGSGG
jgi:hypothetical protein